MSANPKLPAAARPVSDPLQVVDLASARDSRLLFTNLCFALTPGEVLQVEGANGAGKTTLLRLLCGLSRPLRGEILWQGAPIASCRDDYGAALLYIGHQAAVKGDLTARENLRFTAAMEGITVADEELERALAAVELWGFEENLVRTLSAGQRRRVALARLWLTQRPLWILDEPLAALDQHGVAVLEQRLAEHARLGGMAIVTSHQPLVGVSQRLAIAAVDDHAFALEEEL